MGAVADSPAEPKQGAKRYAGYSDQGQEQWQQEALYAQGTYVAIGPEVEAQSLPDALKIPTLRFNTSSARDCQLSEGARHSVLAYVDTAEKLLAQAVEGYDKAVFAAGFSAKETHRMRSATKVVLPRLTYWLIDPMVDKRAVKAGAVQMQEVEGCLFDFSQVLATILESLMGTVIMEKPRQFLALSSLLQLLASKQVNLASSTHAVIQALHEQELTDAACAQRSRGVPVGFVGRRRAREANIQGRLHNLVQAVGPGGGRRPVRNPHRPAQITRGGLLGNRSRPIRAILGGARSSNQGAMGWSSQQDDRILARDIAHEACLADLLELQRLTAQCHELRQWLNA